MKLALGSFGTTSHAVFQDFKVYRLEKFHEKDIPSKEIQGISPKEKEQPSGDIELSDDLGEL